MSPDSSSDEVLPHYPLDSRSTSKWSCSGLGSFLTRKVYSSPAKAPSCPWLEVIASPPAWGYPRVPVSPSTLHAVDQPAARLQRRHSSAPHTSIAPHRPPVNSESGPWGGHGFVSESPSDAKCNQAREGLGPETLGVWRFPRLPAPTPPLPSSGLGTPDDSPSTQVLRGLQPWGPQGFVLQGPRPFLLLAGFSLIGLGPGASHVDISPHPQRRCQRHQWDSCPQPRAQQWPGQGQPDLIAE